MELEGIASQVFLSMVYQNIVISYHFYTPKAVYLILQTLFHICRTQVFRLYCSLRFALFKYVFNSLLFENSLDVMFLLLSYF